MRFSPGNMAILVLYTNAYGHAAYFTIIGDAKPIALQVTSSSEDPIRYNEVKIWSQYERMLSIKLAEQTGI